MKASAIVSGAVAASLALGSVSVFAQDHDWRGRGGERHAEQAGQRHEWHGQQQQRWANQQQPQYQQRYQQPQYQTRVYQQPQYQARAYQNQPVYQAQYQHPQYQHQYQYRNAPYYAPRVAYAGASRYYRVGDRLPYAYWRGMRVVSDWPAYSLYQPPYGYQWVQADSGEFILVAVATGLIASLLLN